ncbi:MAG: restriction endonuclease [Lachnospiraceae bacterium]
MGFWSNLFSQIDDNVYNETKKEGKETQKRNDNLHMPMNYEEEFSNYLKSIGSNAVYISEVNESVASVRSQIDRYKRKIKEFLNLGGEGKYIYNVEELDEYIEVMKYLKSVGYIDRQEEFLGLDLLLVKDEIDRALMEDKGIQLLLKAPGNELNMPISQNDLGFVLYDEDDGNTIKIDVAQVYDEDIIEFLQFKTISLKFTQHNIFVYSYDDHANMYYSTTVGENANVIIGSMPIPAVQGWGLADINGLQIMFSLENIEKVKEFYYNHNISVIQQKEDLQQIAVENINQLSGVEFERVCQQLVENMGFETKTTKASGDGGIDLIAYNRQPLLLGKYIIQCKRYTGSVGEPIIRDLYGVVMSERANKGILMTTGTFTKSAINFADGKQIELIDGVAMQNLFLQYGISGVSSNNINTKLGIERVLNEKVREFFDEKWNEFETNYYTFGACLDDLVDTADLREKINMLDTIISGLKLYESYLMASKMPCEIQAEMFVKIIGIMDIGKYESYEAEKIYSAMLVNDDGLRDDIKKAVIPSDDYTAGMFWTYLVVASDEIQDYSYIKDLLQYHSKYIIALACCIGCFTDNDVFGDLRNYCEEIHNLLEVYLSTK